MLSREFDFFAPSELGEALSVLRDSGDDAKVLAGGMSLMPMMNLGLVRPRVVLSLNHIDGLDYVREDGNSISFGALVRHYQVATHPTIRRFCPMLAEAAAHIGDVQVRHRGTAAGSIAHADPAADYLPVLIAYGATFTLRSSTGDRQITAEDFFVDFMTTALSPDELLVEISVPKESDVARSAYRKLARLEGSFAIVNAGAVIDRSTVRVAVGGVGGRPILIEQPWEIGGSEGSVVAQIGQLVYEATKGVVGEDADYKRSVARTFSERALRAALTKAS